MITGMKIFQRLFFSFFLCSVFHSCAYPPKNNKTGHFESVQDTSKTTMGVNTMMKRVFDIIPFYNQYLQEPPQAAPTLMNTARIVLNTNELYTYRRFLLRNWFQCIQKKRSTRVGGKIFI